MKAERRTTSARATAVVPKRRHRNGIVSAATHARAVRISCEITQTQWWLMKRPGPAEVKLREILTALNEKKIRFVLTGAHAIGGWTGDPRATHDVDILVKGGRTHARAIKVIQELYPQLEMRMRQTSRPSISIGCATWVKWFGLAAEATKSWGWSSSSSKGALLI